MTAIRRLRAPSLESLFIAVLVLLGFRLGVLPIGDNSMFTHLRTGIDMVSGAGIPRRDPYSFTAAGAEWVVQSWLPEWTYGWLHRLGDFHWVQLEQGLLFALLAWLIARLAAAGSPLRTALSSGLAVAIGAPFWSPRPLMVGLICMALLITVVERRRSPWLLVPVVWLWVNSHGSFPLGLLWLGSRAVGERLDWNSWPRETLRYLGAFFAGLVLSVLNPLGAKLLLFPFRLGDKSSVFETVVEWQSPDFHRTGDRIALLFLTVAIVLMFRARLTWRDAIPATIFLAISLYAVRNLPVLAIVLAPVLHRILRRPDAAGPLRAPTESQLRINRALMVCIAAAFVIFGVASLNSSPLDFEGYPVEAVAFLDRNGLLYAPHHVAHQDVVGNYIELRHGRRAKAFIDDRVDMYTPEVSADYRKLLRGDPTSLEILERYGVDTVLWEKSLPLASILGEDEGWQSTYRDDDWVVFQRTPSSPLPAPAVPAPAS
ncbi:MAG: hypothetical protein ACRD12_02890 [Acidimicrobiales bacterium]